MHSIYVYNNFFYTIIVQAHVIIQHIIYYIASKNTKNIPNIILHQIEFANCSLVFSRCVGLDCQVLQYQKFKKIKNNRIPTSFGDEDDPVIVSGRFIFIGLHIMHV